ncbi:acyltransferase domain-containing protein [Allosalinactinospora lopnorensis]|uniref:acyltransferase domain-containing protein n=1 Tax=Allosalinactinospora lopnorensis TaxID=1352348 RepID=UPI000623E811|nr:acyltransferase domain-containing protein [Allosalinactinospora lopnorensis]
MPERSSATPRLAVLFPGQGGFDGAALRAAHARYPQARRTLDRIDTVTHDLHSRRLSDILVGPHPVELADLLRDEPWVSQLAIYAAGLIAYEAMTDHGVRPDVLSGHSLGEITALVAAGAYSVEDGARIVDRRVAAIRGSGLAEGRMVALSTGAERARRILTLLEDPMLAVATENHDEQTVVSGPSEALERVQAIAGQLGIGAVPLDAGFPFHTPVLAPAAPRFASQVRGMEQHAPRIPVFSPILQRYYEPDDTLADLLAEHFTTPVKFADGLRRLHADGHRVFVEAGGHAALSKLVGRVLADPEAPALSTLALAGGDRIALDGTLAELRKAGLATAGSGASLAAQLAPGVSEEIFDAFWDAHGAEIIELVQDQLSTFQATAADEAEPQLAEPEPSAAEAPAAALMDRDELFAEVRAMFAEALEYPEEVFTGEVLLEAELGIDSVKQVELLSRISQRYGLPPRQPGFSLADYDTMDKVVDFVLAQLGDRPNEQPVAASA